MLVLDQKGRQESPGGLAGTTALAVDSVLVQTAVAGSAELDAVRRADLELGQAWKLPLLSLIHI